VGGPGPSGLAPDPGGEHQRLVPPLGGGVRGGVKRRPAVTDDERPRAVERRIVRGRRLRVLARRARPEPIAHGVRDVEVVAVQHRERVVVGGRVGNGRAARDRVERVADHVADRERDERCGRRRPRESAALDRRAVLCGPR